MTKHTHLGKRTGNTDHRPNTEIIRIADAFQQSIACEYQKSKQVSSDEEESSKEDDEGQTSSTAEIRDINLHRKSH